MHDQQCRKLSENKQKFCNHTFHHQVVQGFYQSDGSEDVSLSAFVEIQTVDYILSSNNLYKRLYTFLSKILSMLHNREICLQFEHLSLESFL